MDAIMTAQETAKTYLETIEIETNAPVTTSVIWLHGLGASGHDFEPIVPVLNLPKDLGVRFIFPHAPKIPVTINNGLVMPAWYDILAMTLNRKVDVDQLRASAAATHDLIEREIARGVDSKNIVLAGFSQGGAVVYEAALSYGKPLAGLMILSSYFATVDSITINDANRNLPIHVFHGVYDNVVPESLAQKALKDLAELGFKPEYQSYPIDHSVSPPEVVDIANWLRRVLQS
ncbi:carboxylesterase [Sessilibacter sp. MAH4]